MVAMGTTSSARRQLGALPGERGELRQTRPSGSARLPTVWIPDSRYLVELANAAYKERLGRDVFLTDGEYRRTAHCHLAVRLGPLRQPRRRAGEEVRRHQLADHP